MHNRFRHFVGLRVAAASLAALFLICGWSSAWACIKTFDQDKVAVETATIPAPALALSLAPAIASAPPFNWELFNRTAELVFKRCGLPLGAQSAHRPQPYSIAQLHMAFALKLGRARTRVLQEALTNFMMQVEDRAHMRLREHPHLKRPSLFIFEAKLALAYLNFLVTQEGDELIRDGRGIFELGFFKHNTNHQQMYQLTLELHDLSSSQSLPASPTAE